jgi:hypothetical protein
MVIASAFQMSWSTSRSDSIGTRALFFCGRIVFCEKPVAVFSHDALGASGGYAETKTIPESSFRAADAGCSGANAQSFEDVIAP